MGHVGLLIVFKTIVKRSFYDILFKIDIQDPDCPAAEWKPHFPGSNKFIFDSHQSIFETFSYFMLLIHFFIHYVVYLFITVKASSFNVLSNIPCLSVCLSVCVQ